MDQNARAMLAQHYCSESRCLASLELRKKLEGVTYGVGRNFCFKCFLAIAEILHYILVSIERL